MKIFQPWTDSVRLLSGEWVLRPGKKVSEYEERMLLEMDEPVQKSLPRRAAGILSLLLMTLMVIV